MNLVCPVNQSVPTTVGSTDFNFVPHLDKVSSNPRYIISFKSYKKIDIHSSFVTRILNEYDSNLEWNIIDRKNPATNALNDYPTDFIVIELLNISQNDCQSIIDWMSFTFNADIRYITKDRVFSHSQSQKNGRKLQNIENDESFQRTGGKLFTKWSKIDFNDLHHSSQSKKHSINHRRLHSSQFLITDHLQANILWKDGFSGADIHIAIFDTGIEKTHKHFRNIDERSNWTDEKQLNDGIGHGTFVAGLIASTNEKCPGFAPDAHIHTFRVFTNKQMSYTSWFLDAFNFAIFRKMNLLNLSIGGPDWMDRPFVDKVREMQANNVIMITACGNDGKYGTINNPADQPSVIGVGGITKDNKRIAKFQSRGMTTWELPSGYGRVKPDIVTVGQSLYSLNYKRGCRTLSGTSVASPVVTGVAALLISVVPIEYRWSMINPASLKQILVESADIIDGIRIFEQGNGKINLVQAYEYIQHYKKHISVIPAKLLFNKCPLFWPFCRQSLYYTSQPYIFNLTVVNPFSVLGKMEQPTVSIANEFSNYIDIEFEYSEVLWPWCGWIAIRMYATSHAKYMTVDDIHGNIHIKVAVIEDDNLEKNMTERWIIKSVDVPFHLSIEPCPPRSKRLIWDQFRNLQYPYGYIPRDDLEMNGDMLDWHGDHPHTNYHTLYDILKDDGYYIEILGEDYSCLNATLYSTLMIVDSEEEFFTEEILKLEKDVKNGLSIMIFGDWYNEQLMANARFFDDNTQSYWDALTGGSNIPALNDLLKPFNIAFGDFVIAGNVKSDKNMLYFQSGNNIILSPVNSRVMNANLRKIEINKKGRNVLSHESYNVSVLSLFDTKYLYNDGMSDEYGRIAVFGDSTCIDANAHRANCFWLLRMLLQYTCNKTLHPWLELHTDIVHSDMHGEHGEIPKRNEFAQNLFKSISKVYGDNKEYGQCLGGTRERKQAIFVNVTKIHHVNSTHIHTYIFERIADDNIDGYSVKNVIDVIGNHPMKNSQFGNEFGFDHSMESLLAFPIFIVVLFFIVICCYCKPIQKLFCFPAFKKIRKYLCGYCCCSRKYRKVNSLSSSIRSSTSPSIKSV